MCEMSTKRVFRAEAEADDDDAPSRLGAAIIIPMGLAGLSGFVSGLLCRGEFLLVGIALLMMVFCACVGWWTRGVQ